MVDHTSLSTPEPSDSAGVQGQRQSWLSLQNYSSNHPMKKLDHKWAGPFTITKVISLAAIKPASLHERKTSTPLYLSPVSTPTSQTKLPSIHSLHNPALSPSTTKRNMNLRKSYPPFSGRLTSATSSRFLF